MAVALRVMGPNSTAPNTVTSVVVTMPTGVQAGDYLIAFYYQSISGVAQDASCAGWTRVGPAFTNSDSNVRNSGFFAKIATASEPSTYTFSAGSGGSGGRFVVSIGAFTGVDTTSPIAAYQTWNSTRTGATFTAAAFAASSNLYTLEMWSANFATPNSYALSSYGGGLTQLALNHNPDAAEDTSVSRTAIGVWGGVAPSGGVPSHTIVTTGTPTTGADGYISLKAAPVGRPIKISNGSSLVTGSFQIADGAGGLSTPGGYKVVKPGYASVTSMLAQPVFYCAHRGGSADFPEMSKYAYGQSALTGYPALEISLSRSSDGVWFGLHDASLDRTSQNTGGGSGTNLVASSMTWAQIQTYSILGAMATNNTSQANQPYMRWEELIALYYSTHVIFVDPKVAINYRTELLTMMDSLPGSTNKFIAKYYGVSGGTTNSSGWNLDAKAHGYKTWGYFYDADSPNYATYAPRWDILGMDYTASQSSWTSILSYGKPVMGHICPNPAAVTTALGYGAVGLMMSGVLATTPPAIQ